MARIEIKIDFEEARAQLRKSGIVLTTHRHKKGGYVCYATRELRKHIQNSKLYEENEDHSTR